MAKINADKLKNLARGLKDDKTGGVKKSGDATNQSEAKKKTPLNDSKASGRKG